jgi:hypothetical protein
VIALLAAAVLGTSGALAAEPRWWGGGLQVGTALVPIEYPVFPAFVREGGTTDGDPVVAPVRGDLLVGARGVLYAAGGRLGARFNLGTNFSTWDRQEGTISYDFVVGKDGSIQFLAGVGLGMGHELFRAIDASGYPQLDVTYFPVRGTLGVLLRDGWRAYEIDLFGAWHIAGEQRCFAEPGADPESPADALNGAGFYGSVGIDGTVYFGSFRSEGSRRKRR